MSGAAPNKSPRSVHLSSSSSSSSNTSTRSLPTVMPNAMTRDPAPKTAHPVEIQLNGHDNTNAFDLFGTGPHHQQQQQPQQAMVAEEDHDLFGTSSSTCAAANPTLTPNETLAMPMSQVTANEPGPEVSVTPIASVTQIETAKQAAPTQLQPPPQLVVQPNEQETATSSIPLAKVIKLPSPKRASLNWSSSSPPKPEAASPTNAENLFGGTAGASTSLSKNSPKLKQMTSLPQFPARSSDSSELFPSLIPNSASQSLARPATAQTMDRYSSMPGMAHSYSIVDMPDPTATTSATSRTGSFSSDMANGSPASKSSGNAIDIIAVRSINHQYFTTSWDVVFSWSRFKSNVTAGVGDPVRVFVNGKELRTKMHLLEKGRCIFDTGAMTPPIDDLCDVELFDDAPNIVRFEHYRKATYEVRFVESRLHVWNPDDSVVVADLDGTLTISDVEGHIRTLRLGQYDYLHQGACDFFTKLHEVKMRILYLTARPIDWATASRHHLDNAKQHSCFLPCGPLITNTTGVTGALLTEVVNKNPNVFKAQVLNEIQLTMINAGRTSKYPVYVAGFGNRPTDVLAYQEVGMELANIFLIDPSSTLKPCTAGANGFQSYDDPNALLWLLPRIKRLVPFELVETIDLYTSRQVVLADEREQLLYAEQMARKMQEDELARAKSGTNGATNSARNSGSSSYVGSSASIGRRGSSSPRQGVARLSSLVRMS